MRGLAFLPVLLPRRQSAALYSSAATYGLPPSDVEPSAIKHFGRSIGGRALLPLSVAHPSTHGWSGGTFYC